MYAKQGLGDEPTDVDVEPKIKHNKHSSATNTAADLVASAHDTGILETDKQAQMDSKNESIIYLKHLLLCCYKI